MVATMSMNGVVFHEPNVRHKQERRRHKQDRGVRRWASGDGDDGGSGLPAQAMVATAATCVGR